MDLKCESGQASEEDSQWVNLFLLKKKKSSVSVNAKKLCVCLIITSILVQDT